MKKRMRFEACFLVFIMLFNLLMPEMTYADMNVPNLNPVPPTLSVMSTSPREGQTDSYANSNIHITFNQKIEVGPGLADISLKDSTQQTVSMTSSVWGNTLTIAPQTLANGTAYTLTVPVDAVRGVNGVLLTVPYTLNFSTRVVVTGTFPLDQAEQVKNSTPITVAFSNLMEAGPNYDQIRVFPVNSPEQTVALESIQITTLEGGVQSLLSINTQDILQPLTDYRVLVPYGSLQDENGNLFEMDYQFSFKTQQIARPQVLVASPVAGAKNVSIDSNITITYSCEIEAGSKIDSVELVATSTNTKVETSAVVEANQLIITPANALNYGTAYKVNITEGAVVNIYRKDLMNSAISYDFVTAGPIISSFYPSNGLSQVGRDVAPMIRFDQPITGLILEDILLKNADGEPVEVKCVIDEDTLVIVPVAFLEANSNYTVEVPQGSIMAKDGTLNNQHQFSFTTSANIIGRIINGPSIEKDPFMRPIFFPTAGMSELFTLSVYCDRKLWDFGDGEVGKSRYGINHTYKEAGQYDVILAYRVPESPTLSIYYTARQTIEVRPAPPVYNPENAILTIDKSTAYVLAGNSNVFNLRLADGSLPGKKKKIEIYVNWASSEAMGIPAKFIGFLITDEDGRASYNAEMRAPTYEGNTIIYTAYVDGKLKGVFKLVCTVEKESTVYGNAYLQRGYRVEPLPAGTVISIDSGEQSITPDADGRFVFNNLKPGTHDVKVKAPYWKEAVKRVFVGNRDMTWVDICVDKLDLYAPRPLLYRMYSDYSDSKNNDSSYFLKESNKPYIVKFKMEVDWFERTPGNVVFVIKSKELVEKEITDMIYRDGTCRLTIKDCPSGQLYAYVVSENGVRTAMIDLKVRIVSVNDLPGNLELTDEQLSMITFDKEKLQYTIPVKMDLPTFMTPAIDIIPIISGAPAKYVGGMTDGSMILNPRGIIIAVPVDSGLSYEEMEEIIKYEAYAEKAYGALKSKQDKAKKSKGKSQFGMVLMQFSRSVLDQYYFDGYAESWQQYYGMSNYITDVEAYYTRSIMPFKEKSTRDAFKKYGASMDLTVTIMAKMNDIKEVKMIKGKLVPTGGRMVLQIPKAEIAGGVSALYGAASGELYVSLKGDSAVAWNIPDGPTQYYFDLLGGARVSFAYGAWSKDWPILRYTWGRPFRVVEGNQYIALDGLQINEMDISISDQPEMTIAKRDYLEVQSAWNPVQEQIMANKERHLLASSTEDLLGFSDSATSDGNFATLQRNIFPQSDQSIVATGNTASMLVLLDNPAHNDLNRTQLYLSTLEGSTWSKPMAVTPEDMTGDFNPVLAQMDSNTLSAAWINLKSGIDENSSPGEMMSSTELAVSNYNMATKQWGAAKKLVYLNNGVTLMPVMSGADGKGMLVWVVSPSTTEATPTGKQTIVYSKFNGTEWSQPQAAVGDLSGVVYSSFAYNADGTGVYVFSKSEGSQPGVADQIYVMKYDGTQWQEPFALTQNEEENSNPQVTYVNGKPFIVWWSGGKIAYCDNLDALTVKTVESSEGISQDFTLVKDQLAQTTMLVGSASSMNGRDLCTLPYDNILGKWGSLRKLAVEGALLRNASAAITADQRLLAVYNRDNFIQALAETGETYKAVGNTDLRSLAINLEHQLSVPVEGLEVLQGNAKPGSLATLQAQVTNTGYYTEDNILVGFYDGDPQNGGVSIGTAKIDKSLLPDQSEMAKVDWLVPNDGKTHQVYVVADPANTLDLADRRKAKSSFAATQSDLTFELSAQKLNGNRYVLKAHLVNTGEIDISGAKLTISSLNKLTNTMDMLSDMNFDLKAGQTKELTKLWEPTAEFVLQNSRRSNLNEALLIGEITMPRGVVATSEDELTKSISMPVDLLKITSMPYDGKLLVDEALSFTFDDLIKRGSGEVQLIDGSGAQVAVSTSVEDNILTITPNRPLNYESRYQLTIASNAVVGQWDTGLSEAYTQTFTTETLAPSPIVSNFNSVSVSGVLRIPYSRNIVAGNGINALVIEGGGRSIPVNSASVSENVLTVSYSNLNPNTSYTLKIPDNALTGEQGMPISAHALAIQTLKQTAAAPVASLPNSSLVSVNTIVYLTAPSAQTTVYYTTDGSDPTVDSNSGTEVSVIGLEGDDFTIKAIAVGENYEDSPVATFTYRVGNAASKDSDRETTQPEVQPAISNVLKSEKVSTFEVNPEKGGTFKLGESIVLNIPPGALQGTENVKAKVAVVPAPKSAEAGFTLIGQVYQITIEGHKNYKFNKPITLTFVYDPKAVPTGERPVVCYFQENDKKWVNIGGVFTSGEIKVQIDHLTMFAVMSVNNKAGFADIDKSWAKTDIQRLLELGIISGYPDGMFMPDKAMRRAEFAALMVKALKLEAKSEKTFKDTAGHWAENYILTAASDGLASGFEDGQFAPDAVMTREQLVVMAVLAAQKMRQEQWRLNDSSTAINLPFKDHDTLHRWAQNYVAKAYELGLISGYADGQFKPKSAVTRAEAAVVMLKVMALKPALVTASIAKRDYQYKRTDLKSYLSSTPYSNSPGYLGYVATELSTALNQPKGMAIDALGNIYIADAANHVIREIAAQNQTQWGIVMEKGKAYVIAGSNKRGYSGDGAAATQAALNYPTGVAIDTAGNLYIADTYNNVIRQVAAGNQSQWGISMQAGAIYTVCGQFDPLGGAYSGDQGSARSAKLKLPTDVAVDSSGNLYIADMGNSVIREVAAVSHNQWQMDMSAGYIYTIAGNVPTYGTGGYGGDKGLAVSAGLSYPNGVEIDAEGQLYIADSNNSVIRQVAGSTSVQRGIEMQTGHIYTIAGKQDIGGRYAGDGVLAVNASLNYPLAVYMDSAKQLLIADAGNHAIRQVAAASELNKMNQQADFIYTLAGFDTPSSVVSNATGKLFVTEMRNNAVKSCYPLKLTLDVSEVGPKVNTGIAVTATVQNRYGNPAEGLPISLVTSSAAIVTTVQGTTQSDGKANYTVIDATAEQATIKAVLDQLTLATVDVDFWSPVYAINPIVGEKASVSLLPTEAVATYQWQIADTPSGEFTDLEGFTDSQFTIPQAHWGKYIRVVVTGGSTYSGAFTSDVRGPIETYAPSMVTEPTAAPGSAAATTKITAVANTTGSAIAVKVSSNAIDRPFLNASAPTGTGVTNPYVSDSNLGNVRVGDYVGVYSLSADNKIEAFSQIQLGDQIKAAPGYIYTVAGKANYQGDCGDWHYIGRGGPAIGAGFDSPYGVTFDAEGNMYISSSNQYIIDMVPAHNGTYWGQAMEAGHIYTVVGDYFKALVGDVNAPAPSINGGYSGDGGPAREAWLNCPSAVVFDADGNLYFADQYNHLVRMVAAIDQTKWGISMQAGNIYTIAGDPALATNSYVPLENRYGGDGGPAVGAKLAYPAGIALDSAGNLYIADSKNHLIRMISATNQMKWGQDMQANFIYSIAGNYVPGSNNGGYSGDGAAASSAQLRTPWAVMVDASDNLYIADSDNNVVRVVPATNQNLWGQEMQAGYIYTVAGDNNFNNQGDWRNIGDGMPATAAQLDFPSGMVLDSDGNLYIMDQQDFSIRMVSASDQMKWGIEMLKGHMYTVVGNIAVNDPYQEGGVASDVNIDYPSALAVNASGDIFVANYKYMVYAATMIRKDHIEVTASSTSPKTGESTSITVRLLDGIGKPLANRSVKLTADSGSSNINISSAVTDANGIAVFSVTGTQAETVNYTIYSGPIPIGAKTIVFHD